MTIEWIANQQLPESFQFHPCGLAESSGTTIFYLADTNEASSAASSSMITDGNNGVSKERNIKVKVKSLDDIAKLNDHTFVDDLKMDIEGAEFDIIESFIGLESSRFGQICIEFHHRFFPSQWRTLRKAIKTLNEQGYKCFCVNWNMMEFSFIDFHNYDKQMRKQSEQKS